MVRKVGVITSYWKMAQHFVCDTSLHTRLGIEIALVVQLRPSRTAAGRLSTLVKKTSRRAKINKTPFAAQLLYHYAYNWVKRTDDSPPGWKNGPVLDASVPVMYTRTANDPAVTAAFREAGCSLGLVLSCDVIARRTIEAFGVPLYNVHMSDPAFVRGRPAVFWEIHGNRDSIHLTLHRIVPELDAGPIVVQREVPIIWRQTLGATIRHTMDRGVREIPALMNDGLPGLLDNTAVPRPSTPGPLRTSPTIRDILQAQRVVAQRRARHQR